MAGLQDSFKYQFTSSLPQLIGSGAFANVYDIIRISDGHPCAAKVLKYQELHSTFTKDVQQKILTSFSQECSILKQLKHPNLVLYLDTTRLTDQLLQSHIPALVMEKMEISLAGFLHQTDDVQELLPIPVQVSLCNDIAQALAFLHLNGVIHRDLSSNNILLNGITSKTSTLTAKVGDFGMAKLRDNIIQNNPQTMCPGTEHYMPPEARVNPACYGTKLDIFSNGVLMIEIIVRKRPNPIPLVQNLKGVCALVPELERRAQHVDQIHLDHPLRPIALQCISDSQEDRPSAAQLASLIVRHTVSCTYQLVHNRDKVIQQLRGHTFQLQMYRKLKPAPEVLKRSCDAVTGVNDKGQNIIYFRLGNDKKLYAFNLELESWEKFADCINYQCSLAVINQRQYLLAIGGVPELGDQDLCKNEVYGLKLNQMQHNVTMSWNVETPMPTSRARTTALVYVYKGREGLIVTGGETLENGNVKSLKTVEVIENSCPTLKWHTASEVPETHSSSSGTIVGEDVYIHGGWTERGHEMPTIYTCSLEMLIKSCDMYSKPQIWNQILPNFPIARATSTMFADHLVFVGGIMNNPAKTAVNNIRMYNKYTDKWLTVGQLPQALSLCFVVAVNDEYLLVIGGQPDTSTSTKDVHVFAIKK